MRTFFQILLIVASAIILCCTSVYMFVFWSGKDFVAGGTVGDTIGGLTAPIINLISVILIYLSFKQQFNANEIQKQALQNEINRSNTLKELDQILSLLVDVKEGISELKITAPTSLTEVSGITTIKHTDWLVNSDDHMLYFIALNKPIQLVRFICEKTISYNFDMRDERVIFQKLTLIYSPDFNSSVEQYIENVDYNYQDDTINDERQLLYNATSAYRNYYQAFNIRLRREDLKANQPIKHS
jgi:hypothetical protein